MKSLVLVTVALFAMAAFAEAKVTESPYEYEHDGTVLAGHLVYDGSTTDTRPGVVVVHQWMGITEYELMRARMLAELGYAVLVADMYGKGIRPANTTEAAAQAGSVRGDIEMMRGRVNAAVDELRRQEIVNPDQIAAIGYCFGGGVVLELARSGADISGVVSFHGSLNTPDPADAANISCPLLVCHGADDPHVNDEAVSAFIEEMRAAQVDYQFIAYGGAVHAFTQSMAGDDPGKGAAYNESADRRSWQAMKDFFTEIF